MPPRPARRSLAAMLRWLAPLVVMLAIIARPALAEISAMQIKAAFLYKFGFFVEWPAAAFPSGDAPLNLCIVGSDPFGSIIDELIKGQKVGARGIVLRRLPAIGRDSGCHIAFIDSAAGPEALQALHDLRGTDVLTVTDAGSDQGTSGIINFVVKDDRVRFDINDAAAAAGGMNISSRLLNLALDVTPRH